MHLILKIFLTLACLLLSGLVYSDNSKHMSIDDECKLIGLKLASVTKDECLSAGLVETGYYSELGKAILVKEFPPLNISKPLGRILLLGGIHGDEYSSISIVFKWLQILNKHHSGSFHWRIAPLVNPDGLLQQEATRVNSNGVDLNRNFATLDWEKYAQEYLPKATRLRGRFSAAFAVQSSSNHNRPVGWGHLSAEQADLYELPALLELLRLAWSIPTLDIPESTVFHRGSVSFQFHPEGLRLRPILLVSDAVTLQGHGDMDTLSADSPMKIKLYLLAGGGQRPIPLLSDIVSQASKQLMEFEVLGSLNKPTVKQNYIPAVESTLEEIGTNERSFW